MQSFSTQLFSYNKNTRTFVSMASDVGLISGDSSRVIELISHKTGVARKFVRFQTHRAGDGSITHWEYRSIRHASWDPQTIKVIIYND